MAFWSGASPMKPLRVITLAVLLSCFNLAATAATVCNEPCNTLLREGHGFEGQRKYKEAFEKYKAAETADPKASLPLSLTAGLIFKLSSVAPASEVTKMRNTARAMAERAAALTPDDPVAQEVLRMLDDDAPSPLHVPNAEASRLAAEGSGLLAQNKPKEALVKYEAAMKADPKYSYAWVGAADSYFVQKDWPRAEALFRQATEIEPRNAQAWRFLSDSLLAQGQRAPAETALYSAIAADPSQRPSWSKLARLRAAAGLPLKPLGFRRGVRVVQGSDGKYTVNIDKPPADTSDTPNYAFRLALGVTETKLRGDDKAKTRSNFDIELEAWRTALKIVAEAKANSGQGVSDPAIPQMQAMESDGQLEPAILLLMFRQSYRPALEAWIAANPGGVKLFIDRYGIQP